MVTGEKASLPAGQKDLESWPREQHSKHTGRRGGCRLPGSGGRPHLQVDHSPSSRDWPPEGLPPQLLPLHSGEALTGPMLRHLEKRSSAAMCSYSFWTARCRRLELWWRSYRLRNAAGVRSSAQDGPWALPYPVRPLTLPDIRVHCPALPLGPCFLNGNPAGLQLSTDGGRDPAATPGRSTEDRSKGRTSSGTGRFHTRPPSHQASCREMGLRWAPESFPRPEGMSVPSRPAAHSPVREPQPQACSRGEHRADRLDTRHTRLSPSSPRGPNDRAGGEGAEREETGHHPRCPPALREHPPYSTRSSRLCGVYRSSGATLLLCAGQSMPA